MRGMNLGLGLNNNQNWEPVAGLGDALYEIWDSEIPALLSLSGSAVGGWTGRKAGYVVSQSTSGNKPVFSATAFGGRPGITFDGIDDFLDLATTPAELPTGATPCEMWAPVDQVQPGASAGARVVVGYGAGNANRYIGRVTSSNINRAWSAIGNGGTVQITDLNADFSGRHIIRGIFGATSSSIGIDNGTATSSAVTPTTSGNPLRIGAVQTTASFWAGVINAVVLTKPLTSVQAAQLYRYLNARRGLA